MKILKKIKNRIRRLILNLISKPNSNAIWIFGFQKSGTSAIAGLLAEHADKSVTIDSIFLWEPYKTKLMKKGIKAHVNKYSYDFSKDIIKEPGATFYIPIIESYFKLNKYIFIVRNPFDNIRSILNRLDLPGNLDEISINDVSHRWQSKFTNNGKSYIKDLALLWLEANDQNDYMFNDRCVLIKYEDFNKDKVNFIENLATEFALKRQKDINNIADKPFQPKGKANIDLVEFFGNKNIELINTICGNRMRELGYDLNIILNK